MTNYAKDIQFLTFLHYYILYAFSWVFLDVTIFFSVVIILGSRGMKLEGFTYQFIWQISLHSLI